MTAQGIYDLYMSVYEKYLFAEDMAEVEMLHEELQEIRRKYGIEE
ncbi:hypothetical protein [Paenibacillus larvae]|nr:hypothetical protein [Paenibacillus larvae]